MVAAIMQTRDRHSPTVSSATLLAIALNGNSWPPMSGCQSSQVRRPLPGYSDFGCFSVLLLGVTR